MYTPGSEACSMPNGESPISASLLAATRARVAAVQSLVAAGNNAVYGYCTSPAGFRGQTAQEIAGAPSAASVVAASLGAANGSLLPQSSAVCGNDGIPEIVPLSGSMGVIPVAPPAVPAAPVPAAAATPAAAKIPTPANLCWGLRNQVIRPSQFSPDVFARLQFACTQKGYVGTCPAPPAYNSYLAGSLPSLNPSQADIDAIPSVDLGGVPCPESYRQGGLSGLPSWGDAGGAVAAVTGWFDRNRGIAIAFGLFGAAFLASQISQKRGRA